MSLFIEGRTLAEAGIFPYLMRKKPLDPKRHGMNDLLEKSGKE